jgi:hypothetical protein
MSPLPRRTNAPVMLGELKNTVPGLGVAKELDYDSLFALAQLQFDDADDAYAAVDGDSVSDGESCAAIEVAGCEHFLATLQLVAVTERFHRVSA